MKKKKEFTNKHLYRTNNDKWLSNQNRNNKDMLIFSRVCPHS